MLLEIVALIMLIIGAIGGLVHWLLPANINENNKPINPCWKCILLGIGATMLVPLFLEIAQSKLLTDVRYNHWNFSDDNAKRSNKAPANKMPGDADVKIAVKIDSPRVTNARRAPATQRYTITEPTDAKNYLLYAAYCFLAAAAGPRFINGVMDGVLKEKIATLTKEKEEVTVEKNKAVEEKEKVEKEKDLIEQSKDKVMNQIRLAAEKVENKAFEKIRSLRKPTENAKPLPVIKPATVIDDPQKGRFGGKSEDNGRRLRATVKDTGSDWFNITLWVESTNPKKPLESSVIFYLHDTFQPSVLTIDPDEFVDGKAMENDIVAYGAFTVGAVTDGGYTLLELDLAEQSEFPKLFRER
jgi:hypothetical protein